MADTSGRMKRSPKPLVLPSLEEWHVADAVPIDKEKDNLLDEDVLDKNALHSLPSKKL